MTHTSLPVCSEQGYSTATSARRAARSHAVGYDYDIVERDNRHFWVIRVTTPTTTHEAAPTPWTPAQPLTSTQQVVANGNVYEGPVATAPAEQPAEQPTETAAEEPALPRVRSWRSTAPAAVAPRAPGVRRNRGPSAKDKIIIELAMREQGVTGKEISEACSWSTASAKVEVQRIAKQHNFTAELVPGSKAAWKLSARAE